jgi:SAM-dependent methyltransferase
MTLPSLTDRAALNRFRARAARAPEMVLHALAADEIEDRLAEVNRPFTKVAIVTGWPAFWAGRFADARIVPDDEVLDLEPGVHDLVIHAMALHWADDPLGQIIQCRRALVPDGVFIGVMFGGRTLQELRAAVAQAESELCDGLSPRVLPMADLRDMGGLLQRAGLALPVADVVTTTLVYRDLRHIVADLRAMGEGNAMTARHRQPMPRKLIAHAEAIYRDSFGMPDGRLPVTSELVFLTGWAPADSQPQPLRPGSAKTRLAEALNVAEIPLEPATRGRGAAAGD